MNKKYFIDYVKSIYPEMIEDFWFRTGELHFFVNEQHKKATGEPYACIIKNGEFKILKEF